MDGLPKNKRPLPNKNDRPKLALDDYLFERKLQEVYDKKEESNDLPIVLQKAQRLFKRKKKNKDNVKQVASKQAKKKRKQNYIDAPQQAGVRAPLPETVQEKPVRRNYHPLRRTKQVLAKVGAAFKAGSKSIAKVTKKHKVWSGVAIFMLVGIVALNATNIARHKSNPQKKEVAGVTTEAPKPDFHPLTSPQAQQQKIKFDTTRQVASYEDAIGGVRTVVSQQKLSEKDRVDPNFLSRTATAFNLKSEITTKKGQAFTGVNIDKNIQFTMVIYKDFLVFIQSDESVRSQLIVDYIDALE